MSTAPHSPDPLPSFLRPAREGLLTVLGWVAPIVDPLRVLNAPAGYVRFFRDRRAYERLPGGECLRWRASQPQLHDRVPISPFDKHYFHQDVWAARRVAERGPRRHVDVGSRVEYVGFLTALTAVEFVDIRPLRADVEGLTPVTGSVLHLPYGDQSLESVSCLHVAEHVGLGRYGDPLDPAGTRKAAAELARVLRPGGQLLFSLPVGRPRVCFNAHRIHDPIAVPAMFAGLQLVEFAGVDDAGRFRRHCAPAELRGERYACGMYRFER